MKVKTTNNTTFNPITLEITIESEDELKNLWAALNCSNETLDGNANNILLDFSGDNHRINPLWREVNKIVVEMGLRE